MHEIDRLNSSTGWIDVDFVQRERTPERMLKSVFSCIWQAYRFRIPNSMLKSWESNGVERPSTTGYKKPSYSRPATRRRITS